MDAYAAASFGAALAHNHTLRYLNVSGSPLQPTALRMQSEGCVALMRGCVGHPSLTALDVSAHGLRNAGALAVIAALSAGAGAGAGAGVGVGCPALRYVWMRSNHINERGAVACAAELSKLHAAWSAASATASLASRQLWLDLSANPLQDSGRATLRAVCEAAVIPAPKPKPNSQSGAQAHAQAALSAALQSAACDQPHLIPRFHIVMEPEP
jgi:hypothetical protein